MTTGARPLPAMPLDAFWAIVETAAARASAERPFAGRLAALLASRPRPEIAAFERRFGELHGALYRWDVWGAAYVIGGGCSDDAFTDFRAGVISLGRDWYERVLASPDSLAGHPVARGSDPEELEELLFDEEADYAAHRAFERAPGEEDRDALTAGGPPSGRTAPDMGEGFDFDDEDEVGRRLPGLAALFLA
ncbi:DUF4240 domain-containing protein [Kitasatospora sp. NPDC001574]